MLCSWSGKFCQECQNYDLKVKKARLEIVTRYKLCSLHNLERVFDSPGSRGKASTHQGLVADNYVGSTSKRSPQLKP